jgi:hypothetical protein
MMDDDYIFKDIEPMVRAWNRDRERQRKFDHIKSTSQRNVLNRRQSWTGALIRDESLQGEKLGVRGHYFRVEDSTLYENGAWQIGWTVANSLGTQRPQTDEDIYVYRGHWDMSRDYESVVSAKTLGYNALFAFALWLPVVIFLSAVHAEAIGVIALIAYPALFFSCLKYTLAVRWNQYYGRMAWWGFLAWDVHSGLKRREHWNTLHQANLTGSDTQPLKPFGGS